jgi:branched-chain amino acid transport system substrate-binding protein
MRMTRLLPLLFCVGVSASCAPSDPSATSRDTRAAAATGDIVIGVAWPWAARTDVRFGAGLDLALEQINSSGGLKGRKLRLVKVDDHESVNDGRMIAQQLAANEEIVAVVGHLQSFVTVPAAGIYDLAGLVMVAPIATAPELTAHGYTRVFRATVNDRTVGHELASVAQRRGYRRVVICYIRDGYGRGVSNAFEERADELGLSIVARESYDPNAGDDERAFTGTLSALQHQTYDAILLAGETPSAATLLKALRRAGITQPVLGGDAMSSTALLHGAGAAAEGSLIATVFHPDEPRKEVRSFVSAFEHKFGVPPDAGAALGFDTIHLLADAINRAGTSAPSAIAAALHHRDTPFSGVTGQFAFDSTGEPRSKRVVMTVVDRGRFRFLPSAELAVAKP